jgi:hypothetical protein
MRMKSLAYLLLLLLVSVTAISQELPASEPAVSQALASGTGGVSQELPTTKPAVSQELISGTVAMSQERVSSSVLGSGRWVKFAVTAEGVYRLDWSRIREMGFADPSSVVLYGNNTGQLSFRNDGSSPDDLRKIAAVTEKGSDGIFNEGDYLLFFAEAPIAGSLIRDQGSTGSSGTTIPIPHGTSSLHSRAGQRL